MQPWATCRWRRGRAWTSIRARAVRRAAAAAGVGDGPSGAPEREVSLRLLRHLAPSVRHGQYHATEFVAVRVDAGGG